MRPLGIFTFRAVPYAHKIKTGAMARIFLDFNFLG